MYKRYYDGYSGNAVVKNQGEIVVPENISPTKDNKIQSEITSVCNNETDISVAGCKKNGSKFPFELDDLILVGILLFLLFDKDDCKEDDGNDIFVLLVIGIILLSDII